MSCGHFDRDEILTTRRNDTNSRHAGGQRPVVHSGEYTAGAIMQDLQFLDCDLFHGHTEILTAATRNEVLSWASGSSLRMVLLI